MGRNLDWQVVQGISWRLLKFSCAVFHNALESASLSCEEVSDTLSEMGHWEECVEWQSAEG
jgi:hypothetical protein